MRFTLTKQHNGWWCCNDIEYHYSLRFKEQTRLEEQEVELGKGIKPTTHMATAMREMADWLIENHAELVYSEVEYNRLRIGRRIAALRKEQGLTQGDLATASGLSQSHVARIERGMYSLGIDTLYKIAKPLGKEIELI